MTTRDEAREKLAAAIGPVVSASIRKWQDGKLSSREAYRLARHVTLDVSGLLSPDAGPDQPRPSVSEDQGSSRDHALTDSVALDGEHFGPWRVWFDPPPIGTRECDWHYQHEDAEPECPSWMYGHCASREACIVEIIDTYEERLS